MYCSYCFYYLLFIGSENVLNEIDHQVINIIARDSPVMEGLPVTETILVPPPQEQHIHLDQVGKSFTVLQPTTTVFTTDNPEDPSQPSISKIKEVSAGSLERPKKIPFRGHTKTPTRGQPHEDKQGALKEGLLIENLRLRNKKLKLEIRLLKEQCRGTNLAYSDSD